MQKTSFQLFMQNGNEKKGDTGSDPFWHLTFFPFLSFHFIFFRWGNVNWECKCHSKNHSELFSQSELAWPFSRFFFSHSIKEGYVMLFLYFKYKSISCG
jgi:hypothetical protein